MFSAIGSLTLGEDRANWTAGLVSVRDWSEGSGRALLQPPRHYLMVQRDILAAQRSHRRAQQLAHVPKAKDTASPTQMEKIQSE